MDKILLDAAILEFENELARARGGWNGEEIFDFASREVIRMTAISQAAQGCAVDRDTL